MWATIRDFIDPTMAAISTMLVGVTLVILSVSFLFGLKRRAPGVVP